MKESFSSALIIVAAIAIIVACAIYAAEHVHCVDWFFGKTCAMTVH